MADSQPGCACCVALGKSLYLSVFQVLRYMMHLKQNCNFPSIPRNPCILDFSGATKKVPKGRAPPKARTEKNLLAPLQKVWKPLLLISVFPNFENIESVIWLFCYPMIPLYQSNGSDGRESTCNAGDWGSIPGLGRSPGEENGNPLQNSCLGNPMDRGAWPATAHKESQRVGHDWVTRHPHRTELSHVMAERPASKTGQSVEERPGSFVELTLPRPPVPTCHEGSAELSSKGCHFLLCQLHCEGPPGPQPPGLLLRNSPKPSQAVFQ